MATTSNLTSTPSHLTVGEPRRGETAEAVLLAVIDRRRGAAEPRRSGGP